MHIINTKLQDPKIKLDLPPAPLHHYLVPSQKATTVTSFLSFQGYYTCTESKYVFYTHTYCQSENKEPQREVKQTFTWIKELQFGSTDSVSNPNSGPSCRMKAGVLIRKRKGAICELQRRKNSFSMGINKLSTLSYTLNADLVFREPLIISFVISMSLLLTSQTVA